MPDKEFDKIVKKFIEAVRLHLPNNVTYFAHMPLDVTVLHLQREGGYEHIGITITH